MSTLYQYLHTAKLKKYLKITNVSYNISYSEIFEVVDERICENS